MLSLLLNQAKTPELIRMKTIIAVGNALDLHMSNF